MAYPLQEALHGRGHAHDRHHLHSLGMRIMRNRHHHGLLHIHSYLHGHDRGHDDGHAHGHAHGCAHERGHGHDNHNQGLHKNHLLL